MGGGCVRLDALLVATALAAGLFAGFLLARSDKVSESSPAYDWMLAQMVREQRTIELTQAREGTQTACLFAPYTGWERLAAATDLPAGELWALHRLVASDSHSVVLMQSGRITDAFLVRNDTLRTSDAAKLVGTCSPKLALRFDAMPVVQ